MADPSLECPLPRKVEKLIKAICKEQSQPPPDTAARRELASIGEEESLIILDKIRRTKITKSFTGFIIYMVKQSRMAAAGTVNGDKLGGFSPSPCKKLMVSHSSQGSNSVSSPGSESPDSSQSGGRNSPDGSVISFISDRLASIRLNLAGFFKPRKLSKQFLALEELEFRRAFLVLSYIGGRKLEEFSVREVRNLVAESSKLTMGSFENLIWERYGDINCPNKKDRMRYHNWDSPGQYHFYHCHVQLDGNYAFKGPYLSMRTTLVNKILKDENVLIVKFVDEGTRRTSTSVGSCSSFAALEKVARDGIYIGKRRYRFFAFKDGGKGEKKDQLCSSVKCYFVNIEAFPQSFGSSKECLRRARSAFLHLDTLPSLSKYTARLQLVLSKTITLPVNLDGEGMHVQVIGDIPCQFADGSIVKGEDGQPLIHTDGTGFISEDLVRRCPRNFFKGNMLKDHYFERFVVNVSEVNELSSQSAELPLLMQFRLFYDGYAVKGTVLLNRKLERRTIQVRPSMIKVCKDQESPGSLTVNSFEVVSVSGRPKKSYLSKYLIALLHYGGVPRKFFTDILKNALADARTSLTNQRTALQVALIHGNMDDDFTIARMILSGIPLDEPYIQARLPVLANQQKRSLKDGKLPIDESFYLMGTTDPTGSLNADEVCIIHENGQISGKVLVYRNPGIHFGDVHVLTAKHVEGLEEIVGNSKYGIFFPTIGSRSLADEMAGGDFDGDMYWVSRHPQLLKHFKKSDPWTCKKHPSSSNLSQKKPASFLDEELEHELFTRFLTARFQPSKAMGIASNSWLVHMDRMLMLGDENVEEKESLKDNMLQLVNIYYEALDAPKTGREVTVPRDLIPDTYPHYMGMTKASYKSNSVLGEIYDQAHEWEIKTPSIPVRKLLPLDVEVPIRNLKTWQYHYKAYRAEMTAACSMEDEEVKREHADKAIQKYKQILYEAAEFEKSPRQWEEIRTDALAIYHVSYDYAIEKEDIKKCGFAWRVAGAALTNIFIEGQNEKALACSASVLRELLIRNNAQ